MGDEDLDFGQKLSGANEEYDNHLLRLNIPVTPTTARHTPTLTLPPSSPAKSLAGTILNNSPEYRSGAWNEFSRPRLPELERNPPLRHPQHKYHGMPDKISRDKKRTDSNNNVWDFFDGTSSEDGDIVEEKSVDHTASQDMPAQPDDALDMPFSNDTACNINESKFHFSDLGFDPSNSQVEDYLKLIDRDSATLPTSQNGLGILGSNNTPILLDGDDHYFNYNELPSTASRNNLSASAVQDHGNWSLPADQSLPTRNPTSGGNDPEWILNLYKFTLQSLLAHEQNKQSGGPTKEASPRLLRDSISHIPLSNAGRLNDDDDPSIHSTHTALANSSQLPQSPRLQQPLTSDRKVHSVSSPPAPRKKSVTILPPPLQSLPSRGNFSPPDIPTPYPFSTPTASILKHMTNAKNHEQQASALPPAPEPDPVPEPEPEPPIKRSSIVVPSRPRILRPHLPTPLSLSPNPLTPPGPSPPLALSVRRKNAPHGTLTTRLRISPAVARSTAPSSNHSNLCSHLPTENNRHKHEHEAHFASLDFDDAALFRQLRNEYYTGLLGRQWRIVRWWRRWYSAKTLKRIAFVGGIGFAGTVIGVTGDVETYFEEKLMGGFRRPNSGKGKYAWIHFLQRLSAAANVTGHASGRGIGSVPVTPKTAGSLVVQQDATTSSGAGASESPTQTHGSFQSATEQDAMCKHNSPPIGLEFVEGWDAVRIATGLTFVALSTVAIVVCWILLGPVSVSVTSQQGRLGGAVLMSSLETERVARVGTAFVMGVLVLLAGCAGVLAWLGVSWVVM